MAIQDPKFKIENELHVWIWRHDTPPPDDRVLIERERERAARFRNEAARRQFAGTRAALRDVLARYVERVDIIGEGGKPTLASGEVDFNVTHTAGISLIAVAPAGSSVGIDVERMRRVPRVETIVRRFFTSDEAEDVLSSDDVDRTFIRHWTRKEAIVKAQGGAMWDLIAHRGAIDDASEWNVIDLTIDLDGGANFLAAAAMRASRGALRYFVVGEPLIH
jgi:phosphopantetheine--protein transferase-like protein